jgi:predicted nucleic acid-binding protein
MSGIKTVDKMDILADTNILLRRIHRNDPQHRLTTRCLGRLIKEGNRICVTSQNLIELWVVCTRPVENNGLGLPVAHTDRIVARVEQSVLRLPDHDSVYSEWRRLVVEQTVAGKKTHDAHLVATMKVHDITHLLTFNSSDFSRYPGITVMRPQDIAASQE